MLKNVLQYLDKTVEKYTDKIAFCDSKEEYTFFQVDLLSKQIASSIIQKSNRTINSPILVFLPKSAIALIGFFGIIRSGNFYVPLDVSMPLQRMLHIVSVLEPKYIVTNSFYLPQALLLGIPCINMDDIPAQFDSKLFKDIFDKKIDTDPLYVLFTSGSTGIPKGVVISHRSVIDYIEWLTDQFNFDAHTVFGSQAPFYFDNSILDIYLTIKHGATLVIIPEQFFLFPQQLINYMAQMRINTIFWVPSALSVVSNAKLKDSFTFPLLDKVLFCGEVMPVKTLCFWKNKYPDALFVNMYGPTEITDVCAYFIVNREIQSEDTVPIGYPCNNTEILVLNNEDKLVNGEETGELCVRGSSLAHGYYGNDEKTEAQFVQNPLQKKYPEKIYRTGDLVYYNSFGELIYVGRKDLQIKHMGHRIELGEIESAALSIEGIQDCCCVYHDVLQKIGLLCVCSDLTEKEIYQLLKNKLSSYMLPGRIKITAKLPKTANGKIDRNLIKNSWDNV